MKHKKILVLIAFIAGISCADATPVQWRVENGGNGHYYDVVVVGYTLSWNEARTAARAIDAGWDLVTITSSGEDAFVRSLFSSDTRFFNMWAYSYATNRSGPWIGGYDVVSSTNFKWVTGEPVTFTNWGPGEPWGNGHAISYTDFSTPYGDGAGIGWNDIGPSIRPDGPIAYIAETVVPEPTTVGILGLGGLILAGKRRKLS